MNIHTKTFFLLALTIIKVYTKEYYNINPLTTVCEILDVKLVYNFTCKSKNVNRTTNFASKELTFQPGVVLNNVHIDLQLYHKFRTEYRPYLIKLSADACALNNGSLPIYSTMLGLEKAKKFGNYYDNCPYFGRRTFQNMPMDYEGFPDILPAGEYHMDITTFAIINRKKRPFTLSQYYGEVRTKTAVQWKK